MDLRLLTDPALLIINALAVLRLTRLVTADAFPFGVLRLRITDWANERWGPLRRLAGPLGGPLPHGGDAVKLNAYDGQAPLGYLITCPWCSSIYLGAGVAAVASTGTWWLWIATPLALSAVAGVVASITD